MAHDVFISYSSKDKATADAVCHALEGHGIRCWIAPRDLQIGHLWKRHLVEAIRSARAIVLIFSGQVNGSSQVQREVDIAFEAGRPILPFRIEAVEMSDELYYCIAARHWLDALTPPLERHIEKLAEALRPLVARGGEPEDEEKVVTRTAIGEEHAAGQVGADAAAPSTSNAGDDEDFPDLQARFPTPAGPTSREAAGGLNAPAGTFGPPGGSLFGTQASAAASGWTRGRMVVAAAVIGVFVLASSLWVMALASSLWVGGSGVRDIARQGLAAFEAKRYDEALPLLREAADGGDADAQASLGRMYGNGWGVKQDFDESRKWFERAADQDHATGYSGLGYLSLTGNGVPLDEAKAIALLRKAAERDEPQALANLGYAYQAGKGVQQDYAEARRLYERAAKAGSAYAQRALGSMYFDGLGVQKSYPDALRHYRASADQGDAAAQCYLGDMFREGHGTDKNHTEALKWYRKAADQNNTCALNNLAFMYWHGHGVEASYDESLRWYEKSAALGDSLAQSNLRKLQLGWVLNPLLPGAWRTVDGRERRAEIDRLRDGGVLEPLGTTDFRRMRRLDVGFYEGAAIYELEVGRPGSKLGVFTYLRTGDRTVPVNGKSPQIHELSASAPIRIETMQQAIAFLRFFMGAIQGDEGIFRVIDSASDLHWLPAATPAQRRIPAKHITPLEIEPSPSGGWRAKATLEYSDTLFSVNLWLKPNGMVEMTSDQPLLEDLPVAPERFDEQGVRVQAIPPQTKS